MDKDWNKDQQNKDQQNKDGHPYGQKESAQDKFNKSSNKGQRKPGEEAGNKPQTNRPESDTRERTYSPSGYPDQRDQRDQRIGSGSGGDTKQ